MTEDITAEILTIGDEILYGQILDTNSKWISEILDASGIRTVRKTSVGDNETDILHAFKEAEARAKIILITGGLGPTQDDLTKPLLAKYFDCDIVMNETALAQVTAFFKAKGRELTETNRMQAALPSYCEIVENVLGTAPGMWFERHGKVFVSMPGVPFEMKRMMSTIIIPRLIDIYKPAFIFHKIIKTIGIGESWLADKIKLWEDGLPTHIKLAYLPSLGQVKLRLSVFGTDRELLVKEVDDLIVKLRDLAGEFIYGYDDDEIEKTVGSLLRAEKLTVATAESCTGGFLAHKITSVAGSSDYFIGSVIAYDNRIKSKLLGVNIATLKEHGAVSEKTAMEMASGIRKLTGASIGVSTTGIAGPGGGTLEKPVGTVWIGYSDENETIAKKLQLWKDRDVNINASAVALLNLIRIRLLKSIEVR